jgi:Bacterial Ig domain/HD domain
MPQSGDATALAGADDRWRARSARAAVLRLLVFLIPITASLLFVHVASTVVAVPTSSFLLFISWWVGMSGSATVVLMAVDRLARRLLPLVALYKLSLVFPDAAPSRFKAAMRTSTVESLEQRVADVRRHAADDTPVEAAERLLALVSELNSHDRLTRGHSERVRAYARMIGEELHLDDRDLDLLNWAALLHDVGKLRVPGEILTKAGAPSDEEWRVLREHPAFGAELVDPLAGWLGEWALAVRDHHERWDGHGYPRGLSGEQISLAGRIVAIADVFDVITSARSYKSPFSAAVARDEIAHKAGSQFDPRVVRAFLNISLGRLRLVMGPLSWLAHLPLLGRMPLTPAIGTVAASLGTVAAALTGGLVATPATPAAAQELPAPFRTPAPAVRIERSTKEDHRLLIRLGRDGGGASLRIVRPPSLGHVVVTAAGDLLYTPPPNVSGRVTIGYVSCRPSGACRSGTVVVTVVPVDDPPAAVDDEAATRQGTAVDVDVLANDTDPEGDALTVLGVSDVRVGTATVAGGTVRWTPPRGFIGTTSFVYTVSDGHGGRGRGRVLVHVVPRGVPLPVLPPAAPQAPPPPGASPSPRTAPAPPDGAVAPPDNHLPVTRPDHVSVPEGGTVLLDVLANDSDPDGDRLSLSSVSPSSRGRSRMVGERVEFTAPTDFVGDVSFTYTVADEHGGRQEGAVTASILLVNHAPTFTPGADVTVAEDSGPQALAGWASGIGSGAANEAGQTVSFTVSSRDASLFAGQPTIDGRGTLSFEPAGNANGVATVDVQARDDGGTANGGVDTSAHITFTITIRAVNDPPSFGAGPDQAVAEDAGPQAVEGWARDVAAGPANESGQSVVFLVADDHASLFAAGGRPRVAPDGKLTYTPAADAHGTATVTVRAHDDGGTTAGGDDTSAAHTFTITVGSVNDPPSFSPGGDQSVAEDAGAQTVPGWATGISPGPADETTQTVAFLVSNDNSALFATPPAIAADGTLTYTPAADANGTATVTVRARDDGGTANGGDDTSPAHTFTITVTAVNDPPVAVADGATVAEDSSTGVTFDVLANDTDVDVGDTLSVAGYDVSAIVGGTLAANGGGSFTYIPDPGFAGVDTFTYTARDGAGATAVATVTITVTAVPHPPVAGDDAYTTPQDTLLASSAPGVLANDGDPDGDPITVQTSPVVSPTNGAVAIASDGSFTYTPASGFAGSDSFTYRIDDGTGRSADGTVTITVTATPPASSTLFFQPSGASPDIWDLALATAPAAPRLSDLDGDSKPGLTLKDSDGKETITEGAKYQIWTYAVPAPLPLNGPVTLDLWSAAGAFAAVKHGTLYAYLYDCNAGGASCTRIASNSAFASIWNTSLVDWGPRTITIGTVSRTIPAGHELRIKLLFNGGDLWLTMTAAYPTALDVTLG